MAQLMAKQLYRPIAPICVGCKFTRYGDMPTETYLFAFCGHPEMSFRDKDGKLIGGANIQTTFTECKLREPANPSDNTGKEG